MKKPTIFEIDVTKKYILLIDAVLNTVQRERLDAKIKEWVAGDNPILIVNGLMAKLVKVEDANEYIRSNNKDA